MTELKYTNNGEGVGLHINGNYGKNVGVILCRALVVTLVGSNWRRLALGPHGPPARGLPAKVFKRFKCHYRPLLLAVP